MHEVWKAQLAGVSFKGLRMNGEKGKVPWRRGC